MFDTLTSTRTALEGLAREFEPRVLSGEQAASAVEVLGVIHRLTEGLLAKVAKRVADTSANERDAARFYSQAVGVEASHALRVIATAKLLERLPATEAAVREGRLSSRHAQLVADAAAHNPALEQELLAAAAEGMVLLKDACVLARARAEDEGVRAARQHAVRKLYMWTASDGMLEGRFRLTPEIGGHLKAVIDAGTQRIFRSRRASGPHEALGAYAADALADLVLAEPGATNGIVAAKKVVTNVHVVIDQPALVRGNAAAGERCEIPGVGPVNVEWVRSLLGEAFVTAVIKKGRDITTVAHFGRHIPAHLVTAMIVGGRECVVEGCFARGYLERDHCEVDFADGGPAAWWNVDWMCGRAHRKKSKGWILGPRDSRTGKRTLRAPEPAVVARR